MPPIDFLPSIAVFALIALFCFFVVRDLAKEPFMPDLIERFRADADSTHGITLQWRLFGWMQGGKTSVRFSGASRIAVDHRSLLIAQLPLVNKLIPTMRIPLDCLSQIDSRFYWSALSRLDVFEIDEISDGKVLLPVGLVTDVGGKSDQH